MCAAEHERCTRLTFFDPRGTEVHPDWQAGADNAVALPRTAAGRRPDDTALTDLVGAVHILAGAGKAAPQVTRAVAETIGAERVGIRISPGINLNGAIEDDPARTYQILVDALAPLDLACLHVFGDPVDGATHIDLYGKPEYVDPASAKLTEFFGKHLAA